MRIVWQLCGTGAALAAGLGLVCSTASSRPAGVEAQVTESLVADAAKWEGYWERTAPQKSAFWQAHLLEYVGTRAESLSLEQFAVIIDSLFRLDPAWFIDSPSKEVPAEVTVAVTDFVDQLLSAFPESAVQSLILMPEAARDGAVPPSAGGGPPPCECHPFYFSDDCGTNVTGFCERSDPMAPSCTETVGCGPLGLYVCNGLCQYTGVGGGGGTPG